MKKKCFIEKQPTIDIKYNGTVKQLRKY